MTKAAPKPKRPSRPVYMTWRKMIDEATGERILALRASSPFDQRALKARGYHADDDVRVEMRQPRNSRFNALAHALGGLLVDNVPGFEGMDAHDALKRIQRETGVQCDEMTLELPGLGKVPVKMARSIAFDSMSAEAWAELWAAMVEHIRKAYWPQLDSGTIDQMVEMTETT